MPDTTPIEPSRFRKKPVVIEAMRYASPNAQAHAVYQWVETNTLGSFEPMAVIEGRTPCPASGVSIDPRDGRMMIATLEGYHHANHGDWIIRGVHDEFYPCKPDIFVATYEPADPVDAETLLPESSPVKTADNPAPVVLPTVDEAAEAVVQSTRDEGWSYRTTAQAVLDLIAARVPVWVPVEPGTTIKAGTRCRIEYADGDAVERSQQGDYEAPDSTARYSIDPRTVPAEPEDPRVAVVAHALSDILDDNGVTTCDWTAEAHDLLARLDAARADA